MSAKAAYYNTGFGLIAAGGPDQTYTYDYATGNAIGSYPTITQTRPQKTFNADGSYFFQGLSGNNELKFGFGYRAVTSQTQTHYNGNGIAGTYDPDNGNVVAKVHRDGLTKYEGRYLDFYVGDIYTKNRLSVNFGVRFDQQKAKNDAGQVPGERGPSQRAAGPQLRRRQHVHHQLEGLVAPRGSELCLRRPAEDGGDGCPTLATPSSSRSAT